ncbi:unnamed protein product [Pieris brassicae]|uniref:Uncharacterized protein n=1 Tax=Pieris brassicae TaxID=7116 RepID=A0A9P0XEW7_PIEBR|nr:unnamed protein product [Pieris brassicae]
MQCSSTNTVQSCRANDPFARQNFKRPLGVQSSSKLKGRGKKPLSPHVSLPHSAGPQQTLNASRLSWRAIPQSPAPVRCPRVAARGGGTVGCLIARRCRTAPAARERRAPTLLFTRDVAAPIGLR